MTSNAIHLIRTSGLVALAVALMIAGFYVAGADDPSLTGLGPAVSGMLLMVAGLVLGVSAVRNRLPTRTARAMLAVGVLIAVFAALMMHRRAVTGALFADPQEVPSVIDSPPLPQHAAAIDRARGLVRATIVAQNLPGLSIAVAANQTMAWAEGFGWRDVDTRAPVTPATRFNIGTAASTVTAADLAR